MNDWPLKMYTMCTVRLHWTLKLIGCLGCAQTQKKIPVDGLISTVRISQAATIWPPKNVVFFSTKSSRRAALEK